MAMRNPKRSKARESDFEKSLHISCTRKHATRGDLDPEPEIFRMKRVRILLRCADRDNEVAECALSPTVSPDLSAAC